MITCLECGKSLKSMHVNHLAVHGMTKQDYIDKYGKEAEEQFVTLTTSVPRSKPSAKTVADKMAKPKKNIRVQKTVGDLWELEKTIKIPDKFKMIGSDIGSRHILENLYDLCKQAGMISLDTETTGLDLFEDKITDIIITVHTPGDYSHNYFMPSGHVDEDDNIIPGQLTMEEILLYVRPILEDPEIKKVLHNNYFDELMIWSSFGINLKGVYWDTLIAAKILQENETSHKLKDLFGKYLHKDEPDPDIKGLGVETFEEQFGKIQFFRVPLRVATCYGAKDGYMTRRLFEFQEPYINSVGRLGEVFFDIEMALQPVLVDMRKEGIRMDLEYAKNLEDTLTAEQNELLEKIRGAIGDINLNSPKQLSKALFEDLGLPDLQKGSTKGEVLEQLAEMGYEVAEWIFDYKKKTKLIGTYLVGAPEMVAKRTGKCHCRFNQLGAKTGRFSSSDPNLQNIPAKFGAMRRIFTGCEGEVLISTDYSQIEPRLLSVVSGDPTMQESYIQGRDLYSMMAARVFTLVGHDLVNKINARAVNPAHLASPVYNHLIEDGFVFPTAETEYKNGIEIAIYSSKELAPEDCYDGTIYRKMMKTLLLGMMYSMSSKGLAARLKVDEADALTIMDMFFKQFPKIKNLMTQLEYFCKENGFVETPCGRKRRIPEIWSQEWWIANKAKRQVLNSVIQGWAADVMKLAMILVGKDQRIKDLGGKLLLTVHDELITSAPKENAVQIAKYLVEDMMNAIDLPVPMKVDAELFTDGRWYGESIVLKKKGDDWVILDGGAPIEEKDIVWRV